MQSEYHKAENITCGPSHIMCYIRGIHNVIRQVSNMLPETMLFFLYILLKTVITGKHYEYFREVMSIDN